MSVTIQEPRSPGGKWLVAVRAAGSTKCIPADSKQKAQLIAAMATGRASMMPPRSYAGRTR